ncbi:MAG: NAD(P)/FAD-dependent oxidoreductase [Candidatus Omnitrophica bacterium]|nr:NAD(P)/FAD-dependent oxidoreductase [Candidatus Omnitrophota bacterium]
MGAGPAGLMAAISCAEGKLRTLVIDSKNTIGAKLLISGGGRCNVTNLKVCEEDYHTGEPRTVRNILRAFPPERTVAFFREFGVAMVLEEGTKYFPKEQSAKVVLEALLRASSRAGVVIEKGKKVKAVSREDGFFRVSGEGFDYSAKQLVIATGGLSYPGTGSDGSGYSLAKSLGHRILPTLPALTPLITNDPDWKSLSGITLPVELSILVDGKKIARSDGALLFTHIGFSGPAALDISGAWLRCEAKEKILFVNFFPVRREADILLEFSRLVAAHADRSWKRALAQYFPGRLVEILLKKGGIDAGKRLDQISKKEREAFLDSLFRFPVKVTGAQGYEKAEVTTGGVDMKEVDAKTLESKLCPGLFFAGEVLDVDGRIGGFNFQWAWASGTVVGKAMLRKFRGHQA